MAEKQFVPLSSGELSGFCAQIAMILKAGLPAAEGLSILRDDARDTPSRALLDEMTALSEAGLPLSQVLRRTGAFPQYMADMAAIGEQSGRLDDVFSSLADYYAREESIALSVRRAVTYPVIMLVLMLLVIAVLAVRVLPVFAQVFDRLGAQVSAFSSGVLRLGSTLGAVSVGLVAALVLVAAALLLLQASPAGRRRLSDLFASFWPTRRLSAKIAAGRFAGAMSLLLASAVETDHSLELAGALVSHPVISRRVAESRRLLEGGASFADAVAAGGVFSGIHARMIAVGFRTGTVDSVMEKLADRYEEEIDAELSALIAVVEPTLVAVLSVAVGLILLSVMLPLMGVMSSMG